MILEQQLEDEQLSRLTQIRELGFESLRPAIISLQHFHILPFKSILYSYKIGQQSGLDTFESISFALGYGFAMYNYSKIIAQGIYYIVV